jgi:aromatic ring-cleaving dioxygenase
MRDVRDELAAHRISLLACRDILKQHHAAVCRIAPHQDTQAALVPWTAHQERLVVVAVEQVVHEERLTHEIGDQLEVVANGIQSEMVGCHPVAPHHMVGAIEQQHPIGRRLERLQELRLIGMGHGQLAFALP